MKQGRGGSVTTSILAEEQMTEASACEEELGGTSLVCSVRSPCSNVISVSLIHSPINVKNLSSSFKTRFCFKETLISLTVQLSTNDLQH